MGRAATFLAWLSIAAATIASAQGVAPSSPPADRSDSADRTAPRDSSSSGDRSASREAASHDSVAVDAALRDARRLSELGQYRAAEAALRELVGPSGAANRPHVAGAMQLIARIDFESGRYEQALGEARRYEQFLAQLRDTSPEIVAHRQATLVLEAESQLALGRRDEANRLFEQALNLPGGLRVSDPLWEARVAMVRAQAADARGDRSAAEQQWRLVESLGRAALDRAGPKGGRRRERGEALHLVKESLAQTGRAAEAVALLESARKELGPRDPATVGVLTDLADCQQRRNEESKARQTLVEALDLVGRDDQGKASAEFADLLDRLGASYRRGRESAAARDCWQRAAAIYEKLCEAPADDDRRRAIRARLYPKLERIYQRLEDWPGGARVAARLLEYRERTLLPDDPAVWRSKTALGEFYAHAHDAAAARPLLDEALRYWRDRRPAAPLEVAGLLNNLARLALEQDSYAEAAALFEQAAPLYQKLFGPSSIERVDLENQLASALALGGRTRLAIEHYRKALDACRDAAAAGEPRAENLLVGLRLNLLNLYRSQRQFGPAAALCEQAIAAYQQDHPGHDRVLLLFYLAAGSLRLAQFESPGGAIADRADLAASETWAAKASALCERLGLGDKPSGAKVDMLAGAIAIQRDDVDAAERLFQHALQIAVAARQPTVEAKCLTWLAEAQLRRAAAGAIVRPAAGGSAGTTTLAGVRAAALAAALDLARRAAAAVEPSAAYTSRQFMSDFVVARAQRELGQRQAAIVTLSQAVGKVESPRAAASGTDNDRAEFYGQFVNAFDLLVDWNLADGHAIDALAAAESARNHAYLDHLPLASVDLRPVPAESGREDLTHQQREALAAYHRAVHRLREVADQSGADEQIHAISDEIAALRAKYAGIETAIRDASPYCRSLWGQSATTPDWTAIAASVLGADNLMLYFYFGHAKSYLFVVSAGSPGPAGPPRVETIELQTPAALGKRIGAKPGPLTRSAAAQLLNLEWMTVSGLAAGEAERGLSAAEQTALSEALAPKSVRQSVARARVKYVYVIPDGMTRQPPLEALLVETSPEKYIADVFPPLSYAPSATVLSLRRSRASAARRQPASLLTVGVADYPQSADLAPGDRAAADGIPADRATAVRAAANRAAAAITLSAEYRAIAGPLAPLPMAPEECERIERSLKKAAPGADASLLVGDAATKAGLRSALPGRRFVHLAARGLVDLEAGNLFGAIALAPDRTAALDGDFLALSEIPGLPLGLCQVAAASHCNTRVDPADAGEPGFWLARAFMAAGAEDVVSSQWPCDDVAAAKLMEAFFENVFQDIGRNEPPRFGAALQAARGAVRKDPRWAAPRYWAPWVLVGPTQ